MRLTLDSAVASYGTRARAKLANPGVKGQQEEQLRTPFEQLLIDLAELAALSRDEVTLVGESAIGDLKTRPDFAVTLAGALVGFVELKAPGKGADPRRFTDPHDKAQWEKLQSLPNILYSDGNSFALWRNGVLVDAVVTLTGDVAASGDAIRAPRQLLSIVADFLQWEPVPPRSAKELAQVTARLCRLMRDEVAEQLACESPALTELATDWRKLLFPDATDERFADGYAQAVTFGLLMARAQNIRLRDGLAPAAAQLTRTSSLIGAALRLLTDNAANQETLKTSMGTLVRVLDAVNWKAISDDAADAWLYFYENFLEVYDNRLRKQTGSYYTPPEVVRAMVSFVDQALKSPRFDQPRGLAAPSVTIADPATGTGTFVLGALRAIANNVRSDEGEGSVSAAITAAVQRLIAFEIQLGPFAVAQLRITAEIAMLTGAVPPEPVRMYVTDTLGNPDDDGSWIPGMLAPIAKSRKDANKIKRDERITVVIGNPPYKEKAKGLGGWVEGEDRTAEKTAILNAWMPPKDWHVGAHAKHLRNLYVYFWRWASWKVYDQPTSAKSGIVCFITVSGFLAGPGFQKMRDYLRRTCDDIWVIDCSPEGHQPEVRTRIFQGVQQPVCIVLTARRATRTPNAIAKVRFRALPPGTRDDKFKDLEAIRLDGDGWVECPTDGRAPFLPRSSGAWADFLAVEEMFSYHGSGVMPGRTWVVAPDARTLVERWNALIAAPDHDRERLFHPHLRRKQLGDKHSRKVVSEPLAGQSVRTIAVADDRGQCEPPVRYAFRSFDRQWIIPDARLINQPNPTLWSAHSERQVYLTLLTRTSPTSGPALTVTGLIPDLDHYKGSFGGRVFPLWLDALGEESNTPGPLLRAISSELGCDIGASELMAYIVAITAHPGFVERFEADLSTPGLRIPITRDRALFSEASELGATVIWIHTFGERMTDPTKGRRTQPPRLPHGSLPRIPAEGAIPGSDSRMPDSIEFDAKSRRLLIGEGFVENVDPRVWRYEVSGKQILLQWFSYRKANRDRPVIGDRRPPSPLCDIQATHWLAEYTTELLDLLNVLGLLVELEPKQVALLDRVCSGPLISGTALRNAMGAAPRPGSSGKRSRGKTDRGFGW
ncbi:MAG: N-6 DNA methylase [Planctomycetes bacterium]|nr:N-6 DNA methylase [Planctomycetota bacterium]